MIEVITYTSDRLPEWDSFVMAAKNGAFIFQRAYQDYHADRYPDSSLLFYSNGKLIALLPACRIGDELNSHGGLTFGGILSDDRMTTPLMLEIFEALLVYSRTIGIKRFIYKRSPSLYHRLPADEDAYALFRHGFQLYRRDVGSILSIKKHPVFQERRRRAIHKAMKAGLDFRETNDTKSFWELLEENLQSQHGSAPAHTLEEILLLRDRFSQEIRLFGAYSGNDMLAGTLIYENPSVAHTQYICSSLQGRQIGALDLVFSELISRIFANKTWFSFGISTEENGMNLNEGLINQKEGFGARACVQDFYEIHF